MCESPSRWLDQQPVSRRTVLKLFTATAGASILAACEISGDGGGGGNGNQQVSVRTGCYSVSYAGASAGAIGCGLINSFGDATFDRQFGEEVYIQSYFWGLYPTVYGFDECSGNMNALALPEGYILLGRNLTWNVIQQHGTSLPLAGVLAHEWAHQAQFMFNWMDPSQPTVRNSELEADAFSGYYMGLAKGWAGDMLETYLRLLESIGDTNFNDPGHHGTPQERRAAGTLGLQTAFDAINRGAPYDYPTLHALFTSTLASLGLIKSSVIPSWYADQALEVQRHLDLDFVRAVLRGEAFPSELEAPVSSPEMRQQLFPNPRARAETPIPTR